MLQSVLGWARTYRLILGLAVIGATAVGVSVAVGQSSTPASYLSDAVLVTNATGSNSNSFKDADAYCPTGKLAIGGGGDVRGGITGSGNSRISPIAFRRDAPIGGPPASDPSGPALGTGWRATGAEVTAYSGSWSVKAFVVCAKTDSAAPASEAATEAPLEE